MITVSNAGPIISLHRVGHLTLLPSLFGRALIPEAVKREIRAGEPSEAIDADSLEWLQVRVSENETAISLLREQLDDGESEAIVLALDIKADILLMDEARGRRVAMSKDISLMGTLGVLLLAKEERHIRAVRPILDELERKDFWISDELRSHVLAQASELGSV